MRRGTVLLLLFIVLLLGLALFVDFWPNSGGWHGINNPYPFKEGIDLQGGVRVLLVADSANDPNHPTPAQIQNEIGAVRDNIERRVSQGLGVNEPDIRVQNGNSISVELPGLNSGDPFGQINTLTKTGNLEFWDTGTAAQQQGATFDPTLYASFNKKGPHGEILAQFSGSNLDPTRIGVGADSSTGAPVINFAMQGSAIGAFSTFTAAHIGDYLTITLDRVVISAPVIQGTIPGAGQITGHYTQSEAQSLAAVLRYGSLPLVLKTASEQTITATLGQDAIIKSVIAGIIGLSIVMLFMLLYYRLPGLLADVALVLYSLFTLAVFKFIGATLSLAGLAGFILSIGMAVDANVLIFERIKEELRTGRLLASAIDIGWKRAWPSIRDSNISTLITCGVLYFFGSTFGASIILGFATTLFIGVVISMFTAVVVTRTFLNLLVPTGVVSHPALFGLPPGSIATATLARRNATVG